MQGLLSNKRYIHGSNEYVPPQIVDTDYENYSCVYSCLEYFGFRAEFAWVFGRRPSIDASHVQHCHQTFRDMGVDPTKMLVIQQGKVGDHGTP